jgi:hypothetical protein
LKLFLRGDEFASLSIEYKLLELPLELLDWPTAMLDMLNLLVEHTKASRLGILAADAAMLLVEWNDHVDIRVSDTNVDSVRQLQLVWRSSLVHQRNHLDDVFKEH